MPKLVLDLTKSIDANAAAYFEKAKKLKKKVEGAEAALSGNLKKLKELEEKRDKFALEQSKKEKLKERKPEWYEKFRWFVSSEGFLVIGGRDATSNEIVIKKHTDSNDLVFHTDMAGSPFFVVKSESRNIGDKTKEEGAEATCTFSREWKNGLQTTSVFYVNPEQVSKKTQAGEYMGKGAFMIYGKTNYIDNKVNLAVGMTEKQQVMSGPLDAVKKHCRNYAALEQGNEKVSRIAKHIQYKIGGAIDEIIRANNKERVKITDIEIQQLNESHESILNCFKSYEKELVDFLIEDSLDNQKKQMSITYLWFLKSTKELVAYVTVLADAISLQGELKEHFRQQGVLYKSLPALKIGRLCVTDEYLGKGIGTLMIEFTLVLAQKISKDIGLRFITTDAKRNQEPRKDSVHFYKKFGFEILRQREKGTTPMYKDLIKE